jgi:HSP20 family protein
MRGMQLTRRKEGWDPFRELEEISNRLNRFFETRGGNGEHEVLGTVDWSPSCDITETDKEYRVLAELPKVNKNDVHVTLENGVLTIQGERREEKEEKGEKLHRRELSYGKFMRRFTMPSDADEAHVDATFKDGVLNVIIGKAGEKVKKTREIAVH